MEQNLKMVLLHIDSLKLGDISSSLWSSLFTWVTRQAVAVCPWHAASCVCHLPPPPGPPPLLVPWYPSALVTMVAGLESGHLAHLSHEPPHLPSSAACGFRYGVWWFGSQAWPSSGSLRPDCRPADQLADHMDADAPFWTHHPLPYPSCWRAPPF